MSARTLLQSAAITIIAALAIPSLAVAQPGSAPTAGPMTVEHMKSGFYGGGDVKVTDFNHHTAELIGGEGGWMSDETFFIGGAFYGLVNGGNDDELYYGGLVMRWMVPVSDRVRVGAKVLIGGGEAWTSQSSVIPYATVNPDLRGRNVAPVAQPILRPVNYRFNETFFAFEPEATASVRLAARVHLEGGISYRLTSSYYGYYGYGYGYGYDTNSHLGGLTGTFGIRFF
jgi:hypothetical protein